MLVFWIVAAALSAGAAALVMVRAARGERLAVAGAEDPGLSVHRRQLAEIDDLAARGLLADSELASARAEAGRRLLTAARTVRPKASGAARPADRRIVLGAVAVSAAAAFALYLAVGSPGVPDQSYSQRIAQWRAADPSTLDMGQLAAILAVIASESPRDPEPLKQQAVAAMAAGDPYGAARAMRRAVALAPQRADLWATLGGAFAQQDDGRPGPDAEAAFAKAVSLDPNAIGARFFLGQARIARGATAEGLVEWRRVLASLPPTDPRRGSLQTDIATVERTGALPVEAVQPRGDELDGQDQGKAIQGMVAGLAARLEQNPDDPEGWVRLVRAYGVLGDKAKQQAALDQARKRFAANPQILNALAAAEKPQ